MAFTRARTNTTKPAANNAPLNISLSLRLPASLHTTTISPIATAILTIMEPILSTLRLASLDAQSIAAVNTPKTTKKERPFSISLSLRLPTSLHTTAIRSIATAIFFIMIAALSMFCAALPLINSPYAAKTPANRPTISIRPSKPCFA